MLFFVLYNLWVGCYVGFCVCFWVYFWDECIGILGYDMRIWILGY